MKKIVALLGIVLTLSGCAITPWTPELEAKFQKDQGLPQGCPPLWRCYVTSWEDRAGNPTILDN